MVIAHTRTENKMKKVLLVMAMVSTLMVSVAFAEIPPDGGDYWFPPGRAALHSGSSVIFVAQNTVPGKAVTFRPSFSYDKLTWKPMSSSRIACDISGFTTFEWNVPVVKANKKIWFKMASFNAAGKRIDLVISQWANEVWTNLVITKVRDIGANQVNDNNRSCFAKETIELIWDSDLEHLDSVFIKLPFVEVSQHWEEQSLQFTCPKPSVQACKAAVTATLVGKDDVGNEIASDTQVITVYTGYKPPINGSWSGSIEFRSGEEFNVNGSVSGTGYNRRISATMFSTPSQTCSGSLWMEEYACTTGDIDVTCRLPSGYYYPCNGSDSVEVWGGCTTDLGGTNIVCNVRNSCSSKATIRFSR